MSPLLRLLQLTDSSFPTGGYALSHGVEGLHALGLVQGEADVSEIALTHIEETLTWQDLPAMWLGYRAATVADFDALAALDQVLTALKPVPAFRSASTRLGRRFLESALPLYPSAFGRQVVVAIDAGALAGHHAAMFGVVMAAAGIGADEALAALAASSLNGYVAAAVRLGIIGQAAAQRIIAALEPNLARAIAAAPTIGTGDLGGYAPLTDIAGMRQPSLATRLFAS